MKTGERGAIARRLFRQKLQRYRLAELEVRRAINLSHAAFAGQGGYSITPGEYDARHEAALYGRAADRTRGAGYRRIVRVPRHLTILE
jgi:hypothetical protein